jgi:hypothetical protein
MTWPVRVVVSPWWVVVIGWYLAWYFKVGFLVKMLRQGFDRPLVEMPPFPGWALHPMTAVVAYVLPLLAVVGLRAAGRVGRRCGALVLAGCALVMMGHGQFYSDMTFNTAFWVALWLLWWADAAGDAPVTPEKARSGQLLAQGVVGLCFFGGVMGKFTGEYWSGEVFHRIYFSARAYPPFSVLRDLASVDTLRDVARWVSRIAIGVELLLACNFLLPSRVAFAAGAMAFSGMTVMAGPQILSVLGNLGALLAAAAIMAPEGLVLGRRRFTARHVEER